MKIAVTSHNRKTVTDHAGRCRKFWIYETEYAEVVDKHLVEVAAAESFHDAFPTPLNDINVLITGGMGGHLRDRLLQHGIQPVATAETDPDRAVRQWLNGALEELPPRLRLCAH